MGLLEPIIRRLDQHFDVVHFKIEPKWAGENMSSLGGLYDAAYSFLQATRPTLVITFSDRKEQIFVALAALFLNLRVAQIHAGDISAEGLWDDRVRHMISLCCDYLYCNTKESGNRVKELVKLTGSSSKVFVVGSTAFDDLEIDTSACPEKPFDLVVYLPPTRRPESISEDLNRIESMLDKPTIWIGSSGDPKSSEIAERVEEMKKRHNIIHYANLPRPKFLGLLKHCDRAIGNSSSFFCELPFFHKQHIHIGVRNMKRERIMPRVGGSDRIVDIIKEELKVDG